MLFVTLALILAITMTSAQEENEIEASATLDTSTSLTHNAQIESPGIAKVTAAGNRYAAAFFNRTIRIWDTSTQQLLFNIVDPTDTTLGAPGEWVAYRIYDLALNPDGSLLAASFGGHGGSIRIYDTTTGNMITELAAWSSSGDIAWKPDGTQLAARAVSGEGSRFFPHLMVWNMPTGDLVLDQEEGEPSILNISWSPDGSQLATVDQFETVDEVYLYLTDTTTWTRELVGEFPTVVTDITWSPDGSHIAGVDILGTVYVINPSSGQLVWTLPGTSTSEFIRQIAWNADNKISATDIDQILILDGATGFLLSTVEAPRIVDVAWLPDGLLLYGGADTLTEPEVIELGTTVETATASAPSENETLSHGEGR